MIDTCGLELKEDNSSGVNQMVSPKTGEQQLSNPQFYRDLFLSMTDGFAYCKVTLDNAGNPVDYVFYDANKVFGRLIGRPNQSIVGKKATELFSTQKDELFRWIATSGTTAFTGRSLTFEKRSPTLDKWFSVNAYCPEKGYFAMIIKDVTQRKKNEQTLRHSENQYKKLASSIADPFFAVDSSLKFTYWNKAAEKYTGISAETVVGKHFFEVFGKDKTTRKAARVYLNVMRTKKARTMIDRLPKFIEQNIFEIQVYPTGNGISIFAKDITERKKQQGSMEEYTKGLEDLVRARDEKLKTVERLAAIGETAGMIGHDIRNPLQSIIGELYLAKDELSALPDGEAKQNLETSIVAIEEQTVYINKIVTDLQDYAKPLVPALQEVNIEETLQGVISALDIPDNILLSYWVEKPFPMFKTDPSFMKRILTNLTLNGVQAMQEKGNGELSINAFPREKSVIIAIADTGPGIPDPVKEKIFKPLFTTKAKGQGFGLAVVKKLLEALGGDISFETKIGKGTTFIFELPFTMEVYPNATFSPVTM